MGAPETTESSVEQLAFCAQIAPEIVDITRAYYQPRAPHPYLTSPIGGGVLLRETFTRHREFFTQINTSAVPAEAMPLAERGLPTDIPPEAVLWSVRTSHGAFPSELDGRQNPIDAGVSEHTINYWDGSAWHTSRLFPPEERPNGQDEWAASSLQPEELIALRSLAQQVRGLHQIAEVYQGDAERFMADLAELRSTPQMRGWLNISFAGALSMRREVEAVGPKLRGFMNYYATGYQQFPQGMLERVPYDAGAETLERPAFVGTSGSAITHMYHQSAFIAKDSLRKRAWRARKAGHPFPLPASW